jgi:hypothetical protein
MASSPTFERSKPGPAAARSRMYPKSLDKKCPSCYTRSAIASTRRTIQFDRKRPRQVRSRFFM